MKKLIAFPNTIPALLLASFLSVPAHAADDPTDRWWSSPSPQGMISFTGLSSDDREGPDTDGFRVGYGYFGAARNDYPWGEFWLSDRKQNDHEVTAAGLCVAPVAAYRNRFGAGFLVDLGLQHRRLGSRRITAGFIGSGLEGVYRLSPAWDLVASAELSYLTTSDFEFQARFGFRIHSARLFSMRK